MRGLSGVDSDFISGAKVQKIFDICKFFDKKRKGGRWHRPETTKNKKTKGTTEARARMREKCTERTAKKEQAKEPSMFLKGTSSPVHRREVNGWRKGEETERGKNTGGNRTPRTKLRQQRCRTQNNARQESRGAGKPAPRRRAKKEQAKEEKPPSPLKGEKGDGKGGRWEIKREERGITLNPKT